VRHFLPNAHYIRLCPNSWAGRNNRPSTVWSFSLFVIAVRLYWPHVVLTSPSDEALSVDTTRFEGAPNSRRLPSLMLSFFPRS